jgi:hypothetical protein
VRTGPRRRRDVDDPRGTGPAQCRQQQPGQQVRRQVVDRETQLVPVAGQFPTGTRRAEPHTGVVDQHVEPGGVIGGLSREPAYLVEGRQVRADRHRAGLPRDAGQPPGVAAVDDEVVPGAGQLTRQRPPQPVGGAGDQNVRHDASLP